MAELRFSDLSFEQEKDRVKVNFLKLFYTYLDDHEVNSIGKYSVNQHSLDFKGVSEEKARRKITLLLGKSFENLRNRMTHKLTTYIHRNSGIPLIGTNYFGIIDRGTNTIEVKPLTSCNISCIFCSVDK